MGVSSFFNKLFNEKVGLPLCKPVARVGYLVGLHMAVNKDFFQIYLRVALFRKFQVDVDGAAIVQRVFWMVELSR